MLPEQFSAWSFRSFKGLRGNLVEASPFGFQIGVPICRVPDFSMVVHADEDDVARETRKFHQSLGKANTALRIQLDPFGSGVEQSLVVPDFDAIGRLPGNFLREFFKSGWRIQHERFVGSRSDVEAVEFRFVEVFTEPFGDRQSLLFVERASVRPRQGHLSPFFPTTPHTAPNVTSALWTSSEF